LNYSTNQQKFQMITSKAVYKIEPRMQICQRNPRIACSTDHISNIPLRELKFKFKK